MALCSSVGALALPSELIVHIFSFLSDRDKLRASAVCSRWRECLFYPALWTELKLRVGGGTNGGGSGPEQTPRLEFLMRKFGSFVRELQLEFAPLDGCLSPLQHGVEAVESSSGLLFTFARHETHTTTFFFLYRNLQKLSLYGDTCILQDDGILDSSYLSQVDQGGKKMKEMQQLFEEILSNSRQLKWLSSAFMLGVVTPCSLASLSNPSTSSLEHLSLIDSQLPSLISTIELERLTNLQSLSLDFCDFTSDMCCLLAGGDRAPLHRLSLLLNGTALDVKPLDGTATEDDWKALVRRSTNLRVYIMAMDVCSQDLLRVLKPSVPLERIHLDSYSTLVTDGVVELISQQYHKTLSHFILMRDDAGFPDLSVNRNEDPLVLLAWRCVHLAVLIIHGYTVWSHNLVAISRLRGSNLKVLEVSEESIDFDPDQSVHIEGDPVHNLVKEVSLGLGRVWHASIDNSLVLNEPTQHFHREMQSFSAGM
ncbi:F-box only protein 33 [Sinocyclocheilus grahami]|uniref:F-box only protein 33 n=1 Tax=Sinocyclocheilus grahami TaxID=75366 RepID=UPI0007ACD212|nr:PREDICTED: F-box only protein 33 [Sinocyclocheilus grahami]